MDLIISLTLFQLMARSVYLSLAVALISTACSMPHTATPETGNVSAGIRPCLDRVRTVKPVLRDDCHERPPVLKDHIFLAEGSTFQCN